LNHQTVSDVDDALVRAGRKRLSRRRAIF